MLVLVLVLVLVAAVVVVVVVAVVVLVLVVAGAKNICDDDGLQPFATVMMSLPLLQLSKC